MKDLISTDRDIRLTLANLLDRLGQVQNTERWEEVITWKPELREQFQAAQDAVDALWYSWRQTTVKSDSDENL
jgi:thiamine pyrophosphate-dependent acetolactate synthase large subunit-like protein